LNLLDATLDSGLTNDLMVAEELGEGLWGCGLCGFDFWELFDEVAEDQGVFIFKPVEDLGKVGLKRGGDAIGESDFFTNKPSARFDPLSECSVFGTAWYLDIKFVGMFAQKVDDNSGVDGVRLGARRLERFTISGNSSGINGHQHQVVILTEGVEQRAAFLL
jgi:hypothetical protein